MNIKISNVPEPAAIDAGMFIIGATASAPRTFLRYSLADTKEFINIFKKWEAISSNDYTALPASANTITTNADLRDSISVFSPLKIVQGVVTSYVIVTAITDSLITIAGENTFNSAVVIDELYFGLRGSVEIAELHLDDSSFESTPNTNVLESTGLSTLIAGKLLYAIVRGATVGANTFVQIKNGANNIIDLNSGNGLQVGLITDTWNDSGMNIDPDYNDVNGSLRIDTVNTAVPAVEKVSITLIFLV